MPPQTSVIERFGGLDLRPDGDGGIQSARIATDVVIRDGSVRPRPLRRDNGLSMAQTIQSLHTVPYLTDIFVLMHDQTNGMKVKSWTGAVTVLTDAALTDVTDYESFGTPTNTYVFITRVGGQTKRYDVAAATISSPAGLAALGACEHVGYFAAGERLVYVKGSSAYFSDQGDPSTVNLGNVVHLSPGDGEVVTKVVSWGKYTFIFKRTKFFVFYGTHPDQDGEPIFDYNERDFGVGAYYGACAGDDGVYFTAHDGVYVTNGGRPERISEPIDALFDVNTDNQEYGYVATTYPPEMAWWDGRLFTGVWLIQPGGGSYEALLVWEPSVGWTVWKMSWRKMTRAVAHNKDSLLVSNGTKVYLWEGPYDTGVNEDTNETRAAKYVTGHADLGQAGVKRIKRIVVAGNGNVQVVPEVDQSGAETEELALGTGGVDERYNQASWTAGARGDRIGLSLLEKYYGVAKGAGADFRVDRAELVWYAAGRAGGDS